MNVLLYDIRYALANASGRHGGERRIYLEVALDLMRQYQAVVEQSLGLSIIRCGHCGRSECSH